MEDDQMKDWREVTKWSRDEMMKRVARFRHLKGSDGGLPDSPLPECRRKLYAVIGFQPPVDRASGAATSPVGDVAAPLARSTGGWKPITAYSLRLHSGSGLSGKPPSEPFKCLKRATRFIISSRLHFVTSRQSFI